MTPLRFFRDRAPFILAFYLGVLTFLTLTVAHIPLLILHNLGLMALLAWTHSHKGPRICRNAFVLGLVVFVANPIFNHRGATVLGELFGFPITLEAFQVGSRYGLALMAMVILSFLWETWIPDRAWQALGQATLPRTVLMVRLAIGLVPALENRFEASRCARQALGWEDVSRTKRAGETLTHVIAWTMEEGFALAQNLNRRGFGLGHRQALPGFRPRPLDRGLFGMGVVLAVFLTFCLYALGQASFYPVYGPHLLHGPLVLAGFAWVLFMAQPIYLHVFLSFRIRERRPPHDYL